MVGAQAGFPLHNPLLARFAQSPVLIAPERKDYFEACLHALIRHEKAEALLSDSMAAEDDFWPRQDDWRAAYRPYVVKQGILQIPVRGVLLNKFSYAAPWATGYTYIEKAVTRGLADDEVRGIALVVDSPGGEVAGNFELADKIYQARDEKPIQAFASDHAYSAAYSLASSASKITMTRSGGVGSIGVVTMHVDVSKALGKQGITLTYIFAGRHKVDGNPYQPLPDSVKARIQKRIDKTYSLFTATVARNRNLDDKDVRATEALTFSADEALENGLADAVGAFEDALSAFAGELSSKDREDTMSTTKDETVTLAAHNAAVEAATAAGHKAGATAERTRITTILNSDAGKARPNSALAAALETDMTADQATAFLAKLPEEQKAESKSDSAGAGVPQKIFEAAMNNSGNPEVGSGNSGESAEQSEEARILANFAAATGIKAKSK
jgi:signal peptide peptidase SppA